MGSCMSSQSSERSAEPNRYALSKVESSFRSWSWRKSKSVGRRKENGDGMSIEELQSIPGRKFGNGAGEKGSLFTQQGRKGTNQDAMLLWEDFTSRGDTVFCGVFDGHGPNGHLVARKVRDSLPIKLSNQLKSISSDSVSTSTLQNGKFMGSTIHGASNIDEEMFEDLDIDGSDKFPDMFLKLRQYLLKASELMDNELKDCAIDCFCSGTTAVTILKQGQDLVIGNVGDSRAVLGTRDEKDSLVALQLTVDLKPNLPREAARIQQCNGRVFALQDEPDVARVWLPNSDSPGLAMSRAFGDFCLKDYGVISVPDITYRKIIDKDEFIVLATDGVWDVFSNQEAVEIIVSAPTRATAARSLVDCAVRAWRVKYPSSKSDDCAVVCLFLHSSDSTDYNRISHSKERINGPIETIPFGGADKGLSNDAEVHSLDSNNSKPHNSPMKQLYVSDTDEIVRITDAMDGKLSERCQSTRSIADCLETAEEEEWSALEGITRVNSLLTIPRQVPGEKRKGL